jgi:hypothetical protein
MARASSGETVEKETPTMFATTTATEALTRQTGWDAQAASPPAAQTPVHFYPTDPQERMDTHDMATKARVAERLAEFLGYSYAGAWHEGQGAALRGRAAYLVPSDTIVGLDRARALGIGSVDDFFGGVVPHAFVATKLISHGLVSPTARAPEGWSHDFARRTRHAVLPGYSVFSTVDALLAGELLLDEGAVRVKDPHGVGGGGQWVAHDRAELQARLAEFRADDIQQHGLVIERNLKQVVTHSVGQVQAGRLTISYHGTQTLTANHRGHQVYGGSTLHVVRGAFDDLLRQDLQPHVRQAVEQALAYHHAAMACFRGMFASRCNYDVAQGVDERGNFFSGVLEQSWRIGGASGAEVAALHALDADPGLRSVTASTCEVYADNVAVPAGAWLLYDGDDRHIGKLSKYVQVLPDVND